MSSRKEYDYGTRTLAEQMYVFHGRTFGEISGDLGVSENQLKRWGKAGEWRPKRDQYLKGKSQDLIRIMGVKENILQQLESEISANTVHQLLSGWRQADRIIETKLHPGGVDVDRPAIFLEDLRFVVETLKEVDPKGVNVVARNFDVIVDRFKEQHAQAT